MLINLLLLSCARVGSPNGGKKDSIPPKFLGSNIDSSRANVKRDIRELRLIFDEYITLKDINKNLIVSPPIKKIKKIIPATLASKYVLIQWEDSLQANTTYSFNFGNAIADYNEGNVLPYFNYAFSTGNKINNLYISGEAKDALSSKLKSSDGKERNFIVGLYKVKDTMDYKKKPDYIAKADEDGYFELNYLVPTDYRILAFDDLNQNSFYDYGKESAGFLKDYISLKDDKSVSGLKIKIYPSKKTPKYKEMQETSGGILMLFEGNPEHVEVMPLGGKPADYKVTHLPRSDSVRIWFDAQKENIGIKGSENLKFSYKINDKKKDSTSIFYRQNPKNTFSISNPQENKIAPNENFKIAGNWEVENIESENWKLESDSVKVDFKAKISETNPMEILVSSDFKPGKKYSLTVPKQTISSYYKSIEKSYRFDFEIIESANYGSFTLKLQNASENKKWIQFLDDKERLAYSKYTSADVIKFEDLKPATYTLRILEDNNGNKFWDEGDFAKNIFAEDAYIFPKKVDIKPMWEIVETWDLKTNTAVQPQR